MEKKRNNHGAAPFKETILSSSPPKKHKGDIRNLFFLGFSFRIPYCLPNRSIGLVGAAAFPLFILVLFCSMYCFRRYCDICGADVTDNQRYYSIDPRTGRVMCEDCDRDRRIPQKRKEE